MCMLTNNQALQLLPQDTHAEQSDLRICHEYDNAIIYLGEEDIHHITIISYIILLRRQYLSPCVYYTLHT